MGLKIPRPVELTLLYNYENSRSAERLIGDRAAPNRLASMATADGGDRRLCLDQPDGIPHLVDRPRAVRCDQHREQRRKWSDANSFRRRINQPPQPWVPHPLERERRREAIRLFTDENAADVLRAATLIQRTVRDLRQVRRGLPTTYQQHFDIGVARIEALAAGLVATAQTMGSGLQAPSSTGGGSRADIVGGST